MIGQDVGFALRSLRKHPGFAAIAVLTLALGIGANTAVFSVVRAVLLRPLGYPEPDRLVKIVGFDTEDGTRSNLSPADFMDLERDNTVFEEMGAHGWIGFFTLTGGGETPERVGGVNVTRGFFTTLGVRPVAGRMFAPEEDQPGGPRVVVLSYGLWQRRYGGDPSIVGRAITVNARPTTVVGILPRDFEHVEHNAERDAEIFVPYQFDTAEPNRGSHFIRAVGRLKNGESPERADTELKLLAKGLEREHPEENTDRSFQALPLLEAMVGESRPALLLLLGAVGFVLLVACANLANLLLASGESRRRELAVRTALGASQGRLVRQMLTESLVLGFMGGALGLVLALVSARFLTVLSETGMPRAGAIRIDGVVLAFAFVIAVGTGILFGLVPAFQLSRSGMEGPLREGGRGASSRMRRGVREVLVAAEVALSIVLLIGAGLFLRSLWRLEAVDPGFAPGRVLTMQISLPTAEYAEGEQISFYERLYERLGGLAGVRDVGAVNILPLSANYDGRGIQIDDHPVPRGREPSIQARSVSPGYFRAMGVPLLAGREFDTHDDEDAPLVVIISESMARRFWDSDPIGKRLTYNSGVGGAVQNVGGPGSREVVGVVGDVKHLGLDEATVPMFYTPQAQPPSYHTMTLVLGLASAMEPSALAAAVRGELAALDENVPIYRVRTLDQVLSSAVSEPRRNTWLLGAFAGLALVLSWVGVYGVVSYVVGQRTHEIGLRMALGADPGDVVGMVARQGMGPVLVGLTVGAGSAAAVGGVLSNLLFEVSVTDPGTYVVTCAVLGVAALGATLIPAWRAARLEPVIALRIE